MSAQYDAIAEKYQATRHSPLRTYIEAHTFLALIGDLRGKRVLDLACGEGFYTRQLKKLGAARVVGVDISTQMIELAAQQERQDAIGVEYVCADVEDLPHQGEFDVVVAAYLLHYAKSEQAMMRMCRSIIDHLPAGGRFVTLNENPDQRAEQYAGYAQYGFNKTVEQPRREGSEITYWMVSGRELFKFQACFFARDTYERVLTAAGFRDLRWHPLALAEEGVEAHGASYWQEYLSNPPIIGLECGI
jgi:ubiquinone/menaquinone biosynthesis C-methylase UbiE